jgi:hypothetical protein
VIVLLPCCAAIVGHMLGSCFNFHLLTSQLRRVHRTTNYLSPHILSRKAAAADTFSAQNMMWLDDVVISNRGSVSFSFASSQRLYLQNDK